MLNIFILTPDSVGRNRCDKAKGLGMFILPGRVSKAENRIPVSVNALTGKTSPYCSGHVQTVTLFFVFFFSPSSCAEYLPNAATKRLRVIFTNRYRTHFPIASSSFNLQM